MDCPETDGECANTSSKRNADDKKRRSSILKPKKPRHPLSNVDLGNEEGQEEDLTGFLRTSRRVSFARSNFVKQFAADPENNTIWDSTYEESVNRSSDQFQGLHGQIGCSDASKSRKAHKEAERCHPGKSLVADAKIEVNLLKKHTQEKLKAQITYSDVILGGQGSTLANTKIQTTNTSEFSQVTDCDMEIPIREKNKPLHNHSSNNINKTINETNEMEFTDILPDINKKMHFQKCNKTIHFNTLTNVLDLTQISNLNKENVYIANYEDNDMEFTEVIPILSSHDNRNRTVYFNTTVTTDNDLIQTLDPKTENAPELSSEMELTEVLPTYYESGKRPTTEICFLDKENISDTSEMELTMISENSVYDGQNKIHNKHGENVINCASNQNLNSTEVRYINMHSPSGQIVNDDGTDSNKLERNSNYVNENQKLLQNPINHTHTTNLNDLLNSNKNIDVNPRQEMSSISVQTPHSSFHVNSMGCISCDDTQHLINYNLSSKKQSKSDFSKVIANEYNPSFLSSKFLPLDINSESFKVSLNNIESDSQKQGVPEIQITQMQCCFQPNEQQSTCDTLTDNCVKEMQSILSSDISSARRKIEKQNHVLSNLSNSNIYQIQSNSEMNFINIEEGSTENSILQSITINKDMLNISQENLSLSCSISSVNCNNKVDNELSGHKAVKVKIMKPESPKLLENQNLLQVSEQIQKNLERSRRVWFDVIEKELEQVKVQYENFSKISCIENSLDSEESSDFSAPIEENEETNTHMNCLKKQTLELALSLKEKVKQLQSRCDLWNVLSLEDGIYKFETLCDVVVLTVKVNEETGEVLHIEVEDLISDQCETIVLYLHKIFMDKMSSLHSALGEKFDVLALLQYIQMAMQNISEMGKEFTHLEQTYAVIMDKDFCVSFSVVSIDLLLIWKFSFCILNLDNISEKSVTASAKMGYLRSSDVRKCIIGCPKGFAFIKAFVHNIYDLLHALELKKKVQKSV